MVMMQNNQTGESFEAQVVKINENTVTLDFNHPLAGETLHFKVKIAGLRNATSEELSHGHVHGAGRSH
jgi:FKBP-type peptidyl-prolyl cis-trans isomerase SlyD